MKRSLDDHPYAPPRGETPPEGMAPFRRLEPTGHDLSSRSKVCSILAGASGLLFLVSLTQDALFLNGDPWPGFGLLLLGWLALLGHHPAWLANVALCLTWALLPVRNARLSVVASSLVSLGFALTAPAFLVPGGNGMKQITGYGPGFWLWLGAILVAVAASLIGLHPAWENENQLRGTPHQGRPTA